MAKFIVAPLCFLLLCAGITPGLAAEDTKKGTVKIEKVDYKGWKNSIRMSNGIVELIATTDVGPRIMHYGLVGQGNEFFEIQETLGKSGFSEWVPFGGHRFWIAPEEKPKTYFADSTPISYKIEGNTLRLTQPVESTTKMQKELVITMDPGSSHVTIVHRLTNKSQKAELLAPWSITQMAGGGRALFPNEEYAPHPDSPEGKRLNIPQSYYLPIRTMALWSYTNLTDPRFKFTKDYMILKQDANLNQPQKIGLSNRRGWGAYLRNNHMFLKKYPYDTKGTYYPDGGSSFESYVDGNMLELETLGPMVTLEPEKTVTHQEDWYLFDNVNPADTDESLNEAVQKHVK